MSDIATVSTGMNVAGFTASDWYLEDLVALLTGSDLEFPITLYVEGQVISGSLVSGHHFFEGIGDHFSKSFPEGESTNQLITLLTEPKSMYLQAKEDNTPPPSFIHLKNARAFMPGAMPMPQEGTWWRGRISCVSAFHFGSYGVSN